MFGVLLVPLVLIGPAVIDGWLPERVRLLGSLYWPVVVVATVAALTTLFHIATPQRAQSHPGEDRSRLLPADRAARVYLYLLGEGGAHHSARIARISSESSPKS